MQHIKMILKDHVSNNAELNYIYIFIYNIIVLLCF